MKPVFCILAIANYISFLWAFKRFFKTSPAGYDWPLQIIKIFGLLIIAVHLVGLYFNSLIPNLTIQIIASVSLAIALVVFWSAISVNKKAPLLIAFSKESPGHLVATGPYRWVRHPFYLSYSICWIAVPICLDNFWILIPGLILIGTYYLAARGEEGKFLNSSLGPVYGEYQRRTGMFLPKIF